MITIKKTTVEEAKGECWEVPALINQELINLFKGLCVWETPIVVTHNGPCKIFELPNKLEDNNVVMNKLAKMHCILQYK